MSLIRHWCRTCGPCLYCFWMLTFPKLATNPLINSSPTSGLALAVGREASFISALSTAVEKKFRSFHRMLTDSQVGPISKSCAVLTLSTIGLLCPIWPECCLVKSPEDTTFLEIAILRLWCSRLVVGTWPKTKVLTFIFKRTQMHRRFVL